MVRFLLPISIAFESLINQVNAADYFKENKQYNIRISCHKSLDVCHNMLGTEKNGFLGVRCVTMWI